jgi:glyoxylase-like metal-dependent hydrolase (beta-lactamase superfamily II)
MGQPPVNHCPALHFLEEGDTIDLGGRIIDVIHIPGHTPGSLLFLDRKTRCLLSGDSGARRLLYGATDFVPLPQFCESLRRLAGRDFDLMYSAHDRCALPKSHIERMIRLIEEELPRTEGLWKFPLPPFTEMAHLEYGDVYTLDYFDMVCPKKELQR